MRDKTILKKFTERTNDIEWYIQDRNETRVMLRGKYKDITIYVAVLEKLLTKKQYVDFVSRHVASKIGRKMFVKGEK